MTPSAPAARPRPSGGFNTGFGNFNDSFEHLDENALQAAVKQKTLAQQGTNSAQSTTGGSALGATAALGGGQGVGNSQPVSPREVGTITEELVTRPVQDVVTELSEMVNLNALLGINPEVDDPQTQAKKREMLQRWNRLTEEDRQFAAKRYQEELQKKRQAQQEEEARKQQAEQAKRQQVVVPSSPKKGPVGPGGSKKQQAVAKLEQDRKGLSNAKGSN